MGLFSFIGKALGTVAHAIPGVGQVYDVASTVGHLLSHKSGSGGSTTGGKIAILGKLPTAVSRGNPTTVLANRVLQQRGNATQSQVSRAPAPIPRQVYSETPTMPGGGIATRAGVMPPTSGTPPVSYGGSGGRVVRRKRRASGGSSSRSGRKRSTAKRASGRKLKFGSPAWRKKYMHKRRGK
jgi:hypothetical protein